MTKNNGTPNNQHLTKKNETKGSVTEPQESAWVSVINGPNGKWVITGVVVVSIGVLIIVDRKVKPGSRIIADLFHGAAHLEAIAA